MMDSRLRYRSSTILPREISRGAQACEPLLLQGSLARLPPFRSGGPNEGTSQPVSYRRPWLPLPVLSRVAMEGLVLSRRSSTFRTRPVRIGRRLDVLQGLDRMVGELPRYSA